MAYIRPLYAYAMANLKIHKNLIAPIAIQLLFGFNNTT